MILACAYNETVSMPMASLKPSCTTFYHVPTRVRSGLRVERVASSLPASNSVGTDVSQKTIKRIRTAVGWLLLNAKEKHLASSSEGWQGTFKVNFITLTLPAKQNHSRSLITRVCLDSFLKQMRRHFDLQNYVWRAEYQSNGNLHYHICTDKYIPWHRIRYYWNQATELLGYVSDYQRRFENMPFREYCQLLDPYCRKSRADLQRSFNHGIISRWRDPNSTDVHALNKVKNVAAYISKYMSKTDNKKAVVVAESENERKNTGRYFGLSHSLSKLKGVLIEAVEVVDQVLEEIRAAKKVRSVISQYYKAMFVRLEDIVEKSETLARIVKDYVTSTGYNSG